MVSQRAKTERHRRPNRTAGPRPDPARVAEVRKRLYDGGQTIASWAAANGETIYQVSKVLSGKRACISGQSHRIAVKLGLKDGSVEDAVHA